MTSFPSHMTHKHTMHGFPGSGQGGEVEASGPVYDVSGTIHGTGGHISDAFWGGKALCTGMQGPGQGTYQEAEAPGSDR